ncbi:NAD(P)-binding protein [Rhizodiscina lignyota]|uniref:NAD(P)-binding protein n=1 Tax=Rhizodiscina lignyota TaxID=1504668 RepID=A0A9P4MB41_9PEZI|nr:NAD(P)-binding protein [Rhizodiscina lignyota]
MSAPPDHWGNNFTTNHSRAEGPTDPSNNQLPPNFVVVVTGAGKGLGYHIALAYAKAGAHGLCISSRTQKDLDDLSAELRGINPKLDILARTCDTRKIEDVIKLADEVKGRFGRADVVIANAGVISNYIYDGPDGSNRRLPIGVIEDDDFARVIDINLTGSWRVARYFVPLLRDTEDGAKTFIVISSAAAHCEDSKLTPIAYNLSKIATNRMAEHIHNDHYAKDGILAYAVHPGAVVTPQTELHSTQKGDLWERILGDDIGLCGGFLTWLTKERRDWLSGRYLRANWDVEELEKKKDEIVQGDKLKFRMVI